MKGSISDKQFWNPGGSGFRDPDPHTKMRDGQVVKRRRKSSSSGSAKKSRKKATSPCRPERSKRQGQPKCSKCGEPLAFEKRYSEKQGKMIWYPTNPDGSDHWDLCSEITWKRKLAAGEVQQYKHIGRTIGQDAARI